MATYNPQEYIKDGVDKNSDNFLQIAQRAFKLADPSGSADFNISNRNSYMNFATDLLNPSQSGWNGQLIGNANPTIQNAFNQARDEFLGGNIGASAVDTSSGQPQAIAAQEAGLANPGLSMTPEQKKTYETQFPGPVNTTQPSPTTVSATPYTQDQIKQALTTAQASGEAPQNAGEARSAVQKTLENLPPGAPNYSGIEQQLAQDPGYQQLLKDKAEYASVANQGKSLLDFYNQAVKDAGIPGINAELLNTQKIIDGTEDDIRNEVKAASGFATDSQVLALASARNKSLIKNYNNLLATKQMAMEQVNNMVNLASQDRQFALQAVQQKMQIDQQINEYRDKFVQNAKEGYQNIINAVGYQGLYNMLASDPSSLALAEKTLGMVPGQLQKVTGYIQNKTNLANFANYNISSPYINNNGEIQNTKTGEAYSSPEDFQARTGMTLQQAETKGLIKPLGLTKEAQQQQFENQLKIEDLGLKKSGLELDKARLGLERQRIGLEATRIKNEANKLETSVVDTGNGKMLISYDKQGKIVSQQPIGQAPNTPASQQQQALNKEKVDSISNLLKDKGLNSAVGPNYFGRLSIVNQLRGTKSNFVAGIEQLRSQLNLNTLIQAKAQGATFGALSDQELQVLSNAATKLGSWAIKDKAGNITGYNANEKDFRKELDKINNFAKLDYILKGGNPTDVNVQTMPDGTHWTQNSDGTMTQL